jgi:hypothetical protein
MGALMSSATSKWRWRWSPIGEPSGLSVCPCLKMDAINPLQFYTHISDTGRYAPENPTFHFFFSNTTRNDGSTPPQVSRILTRSYTHILARGQERHHNCRSASVAKLTTDMRWGTCRHSSMSSHRLTSYDLCDNFHLFIGIAIAVH